MRVVRLWTLILSVTLSAGLILTTGCGDSKPPKKAAKKEKFDPDADTGGGAVAKNDDKKSPEQVDTPSGGEATPLEAKGWGTLKGKVTVDGKPTPVDLAADIKKHQDASHCLKGPTDDRSWVVGEGGGVKDVVIWLAPPSGKVFAEHPKDKKSWEDVVTVDQPFCVFEPHVVVLYPSTDRQGKKRTGQKFRVLNSAPILHNTATRGGRTNPPTNQTIQASKDPKSPSYIDVDRNPDAEPITLSCDVHKWMVGYAWAFNHPYAAVTKADGTFEIKNAPAGAEVQVMAWHEREPNFEAGGTKAPGTRRGVTIHKITLKEGDNTLDIKVTPK